MAEMSEANKQINGHQCMIAWYVDDNKISHRDPLVVTNILNLIESKFGKLTITRGKKYEYLGMDIKLGTKSFEISMKQQILETIEMFEEELTGTVTSPCVRHLLVKQLDEKRRRHFTQSPPSYHI